MMEMWRIWLARLLGLGCVTLGIIGLIAASLDRALKLGVVGWFIGGSLLGVVALILMMDEYFELRRRQQ